ncbi:MAG: cytochrome c oxidase subunit 3 family protein, partial [Acidimicrobiales bacterium]
MPDGHAGALAHQFEDLEQQHAASTLGMWVFLLTEVMFFGGLIAAFAHYKVNRPAPETAALDVLLVGLNTFLLLT